MTSLVAALRAVPGVADAEVSSVGSSTPGTLRLALDVGADEVQVATAVNRLLREQFGLAVDADRVQVVEESERTAIRDSAPAHATPQQPVVRLPETEPLDSAAGHLLDPTADDRPPRMAIERLQMTSAGLGVTTEVTLSWSGAHHHGAAESAATPGGVHRAVAESTLRAIESAVKGRARFAVEHVETALLGSERAVVVEVAMITGRGSERLTGISTVREDVRQAVVRATLDALNRRLETLLNDGQLVR